MKEMIPVQLDHGVDRNQLVKVDVKIFNVNLKQSYTCVQT